MSHYAVAVFANDPREIDDLLEPYSENNESYFVFEPVSDEELMSAWAKFREQNPSWKYSHWLKEMYTLRDGRYGHWYNPNGYYDYYSIDGKSYLFDLTPEAEAAYTANGEWPGCFRKSEYDWFRRDEDEPSEEELRKRWREYASTGDGIWSEKYYLNRYVTEEQFVTEKMRYHTPYAFVTPDGEWHAPGRVGLFATSDEDYASQTAYYNAWLKFIKDAPDCYVSLVDCHI